MLDYFRKFRSRARLAPEARRTNQNDPIAISPDARVSLDTNGAAFLNTRTGILFTSNRIGARIWQGLVERQSVEAIAVRISQEDGVRREQVRQDAEEFVAELETHGFLSSRGAAC